MCVGQCQSLSHVLLGDISQCPNMFSSITAKAKPPFLAKPLGGPGAADILTAKHFGVEVEGSAFLPTGALCRGLASGLDPWSFSFLA